MEYSIIIPVDADTDAFQKYMDDQNEKETHPRFDKKGVRILLHVKPIKFCLYRFIELIKSGSLKITNG